MAGKNKQVELHIYWDDDCTGEVRDFPTREAAKRYAINNGIANYRIYSCESNPLVFFY